jgi:ABC-type bacteriocin/lantibiotic exporter with double-glycine peptidase domain
MKQKIKEIRIGIILAGVFILFAVLFFIKRNSLHSTNIDSREKGYGIFQVKENNCGPIALKMIFDHYYIPSSLTEIEMKINENDKGTSMLDMKDMAEFKGLHAEGWRLSLEDLLKAKFPLILFVNGDHYIVADSVISDTMYVRDPSFGKLKLRTNKLSETWNGETLVFRKK